MAGSEKEGEFGGNLTKYYIKHMQVARERAVWEYREHRTERSDVSRNIIKQAHTKHRQRSKSCMSLHNKVILYMYFQFHNIRSNVQNCGAVSSSTTKLSAVRFHVVAWYIV